MISFFTLLPSRPIRPRAIRYFRSQRSRSGEFHDYDAILFLFGDVAYRVTIKRARWNGASEKKGRWIIHPLASTSIAVKNWAASAYTIGRVSVSIIRWNRRDIGYPHAYVRTCMRRPMDFLVKLPLPLAARLARRAESRLTTDFFALRTASFASSKTPLLQQQPCDRVRAR